MSFISYSQNLEDVMLWRALKHVDKGFYIDVGANHPEVDSVTKIFYEAGWRGINIEPVEQWFSLLEKERPRDINLAVAAGSEEKKITLYELPDTGLSTFDLATAERHECDQGYVKTPITVPVRTLNQICQTYHASPIHFLKVDVEGAELDVLRGIDLGSIRPWIILIEATLPNLKVEDYEAWEPLLISNNYYFVYFDGLNRFYISKEKYKKLSSSFLSPPNVFDGFELAKYVKIKTENDKVINEIKNLNAEFEANQKHSRRLEQDALQKEKLIQSLQNKLSENEQKTEQVLSKLLESEQKIKQLQDQMDGSNQRTEEFVQIHRDLVSTFEILSNQFIELDRNKALISSELESTKTNFSKIKIELLDAQNSVYYLEEELASIKENNVALQKMWNNVDFQIKEIYSSTSWRLTRPLRELKRSLVWLYRLPIKLIKFAFHLTFRACIPIVIKSHRIRNGLKKIFNRFPKVYLKLLKISAHYGIAAKLAGVNAHSLGSDLIDFEGAGMELDQRIDMVRKEISQTFEKNKKLSGAHATQKSPLEKFYS